MDGQMMDALTTDEQSSTDEPTAGRPTATRRWDPFALGVAGATALGLAIRLYYILVRRPTCVDDVVDGTCFRVWGDALYSHWQGRLLADGEWFVNGWQYAQEGRLQDSAGDPPFYATFLGLLSFFGIESGTSHRVASAIVGCVAIVLVALIARRLSGPVAGVIAAVLAAIHPMLWINDIMLMSEALYAPLVLLTVIAAYRFIDEPTNGRAALLGLSISVAALTRAEAAFLFGFMVLPIIFWVIKAGWGRRFTLLAVCWAVGLAALAPWLGYNLARFEEPVLMTSATGAVLMAGSCDTAWEGDSLGYWALCFDQRELWDDLEAAYPGATLDPPDQVIYDESVIDAWNREQATEYITDNADRLPVVVAARIGRALEVYQVRHTLDLNWRIEGRGKLPSTIGLYLYYVLVPLTLLGLIDLRRRRISLTPLLSLWGAVLLAVATTFGVTRYRLPVDLAMIIAGAIGIAWLVARIRPVPAEE
jgi:4-amino-4-deoxy-L-arabinose transferase-like glycosyltransferase